MIELQIFRLERADGCGRSYENVIQTYLRISALCTLPVIICSVMTYFTVCQKTTKKYCHQGLISTDAFLATHVNVRKFYSGK